MAETQLTPLEQLEQFGNTIVDNVFEQIHITLCQKLATFFGVRLFSFPGPDMVRLTDEMLAPCLILTGPGLEQTWGPIEQITVGNGTSEIGLALTRTYYHGQYYKMSYSLAYFLENNLDLLKANQKYINFFQQYQYLNVDGLLKKYPIIKREPLSSENIVNFSNILAARGSFWVEKVLILDARMYEDSGLVYNLKAKVGLHDN